MISLERLVIIIVAAILLLGAVALYRTYQTDLPVCVQALVPSAVNVTVSHFVDVKVALALDFLGRAKIVITETPMAVPTGRSVAAQSVVARRSPSPVDALLAALGAVGKFVIQKVSHISIISRNGVKLNHA